MGKVEIDGERRGGVAGNETRRQKERRGRALSKLSEDKKKCR